jgi:hypothetical protein
MLVSPPSPTRLLGKTKRQPRTIYAPSDHAGNCAFAKNVHVVGRASRTGFDWSGAFLIYDARARSLTKSQPAAQPVSPQAAQRVTPFRVACFEN